MLSEIDVRESLKGRVRVENMNIEIDSHHYIVLSRLHAWMEEVALHFAKGVMLDYGCGGQPYRSFFEEKITRYIGADIAAAAGVKLDIEFLPEQSLPISNDKIDIILSTQVIEHVSDVDFYLRECYRLLKTGGILIITAPMQWRHHEAPFDYLRFTRYGLIKMLTENGFQIAKIDPCGGVYALMGQILLNHLSDRGIRKKYLFKLINSISLWLDSKYPDPDETIVWMCLAIKT
jgi:SAM-dependent methyltransferase